MSRFVAYSIILATWASAQRPVAIDCFVWDDHFGDGEQHATEPGVAGITVQLWNGAKTSLIASTTTTSAGRALFNVRDPGQYRLRVLLSSDTAVISPKHLAGAADADDSDFNPSGTNAGYSDIFVLTTDSQTLTSVDCGLILEMLPHHTIGNRVFKATAAGTQPTEGYKSTSATVELLDAGGTVLQTTTTRRLGWNYAYYGFNAPPGLYRLRFAPLDDAFIPTPFQGSGGDALRDSDIDARGLTGVFALGAGQVRDDLDAGFVRVFQLGNLVWNDEDGDGRKDGDEAGIPDVPVELWDGARTRRWDSTVTDETGAYWLTGPGPGNYRIWVLRPLPEDEFSPKHTGTDPAVDSDINNTGPHFGFTDIIPVEDTLLSNNSLDAGIKLAPGRRVLTPLRMTEINRATRSLTFSGPAGGTYQLETGGPANAWIPFGLPFVTGAASHTVPLEPDHWNLSRHFWRVRRLR